MGLFNRKPNQTTCRHKWNVTEEQARKSMFLRADCTRCGFSIDATQLVAWADRVPSRGWRKFLLDGFKKEGR